jgi:hypothetical protein
MKIEVKQKHIDLAPKIFSKGKSIPMLSDCNCGKGKVP